MTLQNDGLIFLAQYVKYLLFFCDAGYRLIDDLERFERLGCGVKLSDSPIDQDQPGKLFFFFLRAAIPAGYGFAHAGKIVVLTQRISVASLLTGPFLSTNNELAIVRFLHAAVFPNNHGRDGVRPLDMRNIKALDRSEE